MMRLLLRLAALLTGAFLLVLPSCNNKSSPEASKSTGADQPRLFVQLDKAQTGIDFQNSLTESPEYNYLNFDYLYVGGGVGVGDINNDGLPDLYLVSITGANKMYLNKGDFKFEDITAKAGLAADQGIKTGVTMVDINGDGYLDIYVCRTGRDPETRSNFLFINNKDLTFTEKAKSYGLDDQAPSTHANFFDFDRTATWTCIC